MRDRKILLFELNEVPPRIVDEFRDWRPRSVLARRFGEFRRYDAVAEDEGELHPWSTWPSVHRGVSNAVHGIADFGQDLSEADAEAPPIWKRLASAGVRTGVCGSLHASPLPADLEGYAFYVPDVFAAGSECFPRQLEVFQEFSLAASRASARNVASGLPWGAALKLLAAAPGLGLKPATAWRAGRQLLDERVRPWRRVRRRTVQSELAFDVFLRQLEATRPDFATFFTNHVASSMHRYWAASFPADYDEFGYDGEWTERYGSEIEFAMDRADAMIGRLLAFTDRNPAYTLVVASSMGQAATEAKPVLSQLYPSDVARFLAALGLPEGTWSRRPAMLPQVNVLVDEPRRAEFRETLGALAIDGRPLGFREGGAGFFSLDLGHPNLHERRVAVRLGERELTLSDLALEPVRIEDVTGTSAYHVPKGTLLVHDPEGARRQRGAVECSFLDVAPSLLANYGLPIPAPLAGRPAF